ncbi:unnamed protein product [Ectocarpus sp. 4 AP-2014]
MAPTDRAALVALYNATDGANWSNRTNWNTDAPLGQCYGVKVNDQGRVEELELTGNILKGHIPPQLGDLGALQHLSLYNNQLAGHIPPQLGQLGALQYLSLSNNELDGHIPAQLGQLGALQYLYLDNNGLHGHIPPELGDLSELQKLWLNGNELTGHIPPQLGQLGALQSLHLSANKLDGEIPASLGQLTNLETLDLHNNKLSGPIPRELGALSKLESLSIKFNKLTGLIRPELGGLSKLETLWLQNNKFTGPIPQELGALGALRVLRVESNQLSGPIPPELGKLSSLTFLDLENNMLSAFWDHSSEVARDEELQQGCSARGSIPEQLDGLLALFRKLERTSRHTLGLNGNPWKEPPEVVVKKGVAAASEYFADLFKEGVSVRRNMIKVVLVGQEGAGKTSLRQSIRSRKPTPTSGPAESTVQIDVEEIEMDDGVSLRIYDCAGQVAYTGLLQMFLSPRAVTLLACNTEAFGERGNWPAGGNSLNEDLDKLRELRVCDWLRSLSFRIPDSDVVAVATKCDRAAGMAVVMAERIERAIRKWLREWSRSKMTAVRVEDGVSLISCIPSAPKERDGFASGKRKRPENSMWACDWRQDTPGEPLPSLLRRVTYNSKGHIRGAALVLPRSWNIALVVLDALGNGRDPVDSIREMDVEADRRPARDEGIAATSTQQHDGLEGITWADLSAKWKGVVQALKEDGVTVMNPDHALEGALSIREHEGSLVRHETYVFMDVTWLAKILKPLLNHREDEDFFGSLSLGDTGITLDEQEDKASWQRFKQTGVLKPELAGLLWPGDLCDYVLPTLESLGLAHQLYGHFAEGLVVLLRLGEERPASVGKELDKFRRDHEAIFSVTWKIFMGVPPGAVEKVLTRCCSTGELRTFWRFGVLVQGSMGGVTAGKTFAMLVEYSHEKGEIDMKVYGNIATTAPWAALSLGISAVRVMCSEFPGLRWRASLKCPEHEQDMHISNTATRPGDKLLQEHGCTLCTSETGGVGAAATELLQMVDVLQSRGEMFREVHGRFVDLQRQYHVLGPESSGGFHPEQARRRFEAWLTGMREEAASLLPGGGGDVEENAKAGERKDVSSVLEEVGKLQRLVGDLQQRLGQHDQDVRGWLGAVDKRFEAIIDADTGAIKQREFLVAMLMKVRSEGIDTPRQACFLPEWNFAESRGLSEHEQTPEVWVMRLHEWWEDDFKQGKGVFWKKKRLFLLCAHTHRLVPCGPNGQGYDIQQLRTWARKSISATAFALQVVCSTLGAIAAAPLAATPVAAAGGVVEATVSEALGSLQSKLEGLTLEDHQTANLEGSAYASLREFIHGVEDDARIEISKATKKAHKKPRALPSSSEFVFFAQKMAQVQRHDGDAAVQWVLKGQEDAWRRRRACGGRVKDGELRECSGHQVKPGDRLYASW